MDGLNLDMNQEEMVNALLPRVNQMQGGNPRNLEALLPRVSKLRGGNPQGLDAVLPRVAALQEMRG